ncbi:MAG: carboxypeptidase-like regulatory domain-containing protein, partial [Spirosomaceae bacterium]|nr:carboxypeptidase-like regulatory domain-containing protein [Spirosomataceae bacterium]
MIISTQWIQLNRRKFLLPLVLVFTISIGAIAQNIKGKVTDDQGQSLPGVSVIVKGANNGSITDADGNYSLTADKNATLVFTYIGYTTKEVA